MQRQEKYEPVILNLSKSQEIRQPKSYFLLFVSSLVVLSLLVVFTIWYFYTHPWNPQTTVATVTTTQEFSEPETETNVVAEQTPIPTATPKPMPAVVQATPTPEIVKGRLTLNSYPENAEVVVDGEALGYTPLHDYELAPGIYTVTFAYEGRTSSQKLTISAGKTTEYIHRFEGFGSIKIETTRSGSDITVNGKPVGKSPLLVEGLSPGTYTIVVSKSGYHTTEETLTLGKGEHQEVFITIRRLGTRQPVVEDPQPTRRPLHPSERLQ